ncbi:putative Fe-S cluster protein YjdI [Planomicrobium soli]|uniref:Putative Fe-S cluster protein YjdI n=1 Tax=Planomicrobium soli TaxID=1176648 RepID=A0A2P8H1H5_9BACL|nr:(4Fe-4S)-binding protein [Planomicrobium soli]PSL40065.1 putative Fe-S cluster protein YjdI [Planomicrobium soli]
MGLVPKVYTGEEVDVSFTPSLCIHAAECVKGHPEVFDTKRRPWIIPDQGSANAVADVIARCPSGALQYLRKDQRANELPEVPTTIAATVSGQFVVRGDLRIDHQEGQLKTYRATLCGCGNSHNQPFCDKSSLCKQGGA